MPFVLPAFNLAVNIWRAGAIPPVGAPAVVTFGNLSPGKTISEGLGALGHVMWLRLPRFTDIRRFDIVEVPAASGRFYKVFEVDDIGKGFPNEHRFALIQTDYSGWPQPYP